MYEMEGALLATPYQVIQLPSLPGPAGRPLVRCTSRPIRFPGSVYPRSPLVSYRSDTRFHR
jgi:hypothetical protein